MIAVTPRIALREDELVESFVRASGPGGQNVNKVSTAVELRFDAANSPALAPPVLARLKTLAGRRMTRDGVIIIEAQRFRVLERNREDARERLFELIRAASIAPKPRRPTRPTLGSKERRLASKAQRSKIKSGRSGVSGPEDQDR